MVKASGQLFYRWILACIDHVGQCGTSLSPEVKSSDEDGKRRYLGLLSRYLSVLGTWARNVDGWTYPLASYLHLMLMSFPAQTTQKFSIPKTRIWSQWFTVESLPSTSKLLSPLGASDPTLEWTSTVYLLLLWGIHTNASWPANLQLARLQFAKQCNNSTF